MREMQDTIAAVATASGQAAVGIVRLSGERALEIAAAVVGLTVDRLDRTVRLATARAPSGERIDDVLVFAMRAPRSYTGEDVVELQGHGGAINVARLLRAVLERGARLAAPGEFSRRAFENGKLDLLRAEGLLGVIEASSERAWRLAQAQLGGTLGTLAAQLEARAIRVLAELEGSLDFPEEDLEEETSAWMSAELTSLRDTCASLAASYRAGAAVRNGITVALVGSVNVGKSSLLNAFAGKPRALVSDEPGTTRDYVEVVVEWNGVAVTLIDTAGLREATDALERSGVALGQTRAAQADVVLAINDGEGQWPNASDRRTLYVRSKADIDRVVEAPQGAQQFSVSAVTGHGLEALRRAVLEQVGVGAAEEGELVVTERQHALAAKGRDAFGQAAARMTKYPKELVSYDVREGVRVLFELRGTAAEDLVVDEIFARFCIGK